MFLFVLLMDSQNTISKKLVNNSIWLILDDLLHAIQSTLPTSSLQRVSHFWINMSSPCRLPSGGRSSRVGFSCSLSSSPGLKPSSGWLTSQVNPISSKREWCLNEMKVACGRALWELIHFRIVKLRIFSYLDGYFFPGILFSLQIRFPGGGCPFSWEYMASP